MNILGTIVVGDYASVRVSFFDDDGVAATPTAATYRVLDVTSGEEIRAATAISPLATVVDIPLVGDDVALVDEDAESERHAIEVTATYGTDGAGNPRTITRSWRLQVQLSTELAEDSSACACD